MTYIDWSDSDGLFDMLVEYVSDERNEAHGDGPREHFLKQLQNRLRGAQESTTDLPGIMEKLKQIIATVSPEFRGDPVMDHLAACLEELERIKDE